MSQWGGGEGLPRPDPRTLSWGVWDHLFVCMLPAMSVCQQHIQICFFFVPCPQKVYYGSC